MVTKKELLDSIRFQVTWLNKQLYFRNISLKEYEIAKETILNLFESTNLISKIQKMIEEIEEKK